MSIVFFFFCILDITGYSFSEQSFLFSLRNTKGVRPVKFPIGNHNRRRAILNDPGRGPSFGNGDLILEGQKGHSLLGKSYHRGQLKGMQIGNKSDFLSGTSSFVLRELEAFYLGGYLLSPPSGGQGPYVCVNVPCICERLFALT